MDFGLKKSIHHKTGFSISFLLLIVLPVLTFFSFLPVSAGADEPSHQATAWYAVHHFNLPKVNYQPSDNTPTSLVVNPCYVNSYHFPNIECLKSEKHQLNTYTSTPISNYALPYFVIVGIGQEMAIHLNWNFAPLGGRLAGLCLNLFVLFIASKIFSKYTKRANILLFCALTPMTIFYLTVVNPSGWEISTSILFLATLIDYIKSKRSNGKVMFRSSTGLLISASLFVTARPLAIGWLCLIIVLTYSVMGIPKTLLVSLGKLLFPSMILAAGWNLTHKPGLLVLPNHVGQSDIGFNNYISWMLQSLNLMPEYFRQMVGVLGWGDVAISPFVSLIWIFVFAFVIGVNVSRIARPWIFGTIAGIGLVIFPALIETIYWNSWPAWWQGRYELPFLVPLLILVLLRNEEGKNMIVYLFGFSLFVKVYMQVFAFLRYGYGLSDLGFPKLSQEIQFSTILTVTFLVCTIFQTLMASLWLKSTSIFSMQVEK